MKQYRPPRHFPLRSCCSQHPKRHSNLCRTYSFLKPKRVHFYGLSFIFLFSSCVFPSFSCPSSSSCRQAQYYVAKSLNTHSSWLPFQVLSSCSKFQCHVRSISSQKNLFFYNSCILLSILCHIASSVLFFLCFVKLFRASSAHLQFSLSEIFPRQSVFFFKKKKKTVL